MSASQICQETSRDGQDRVRTVAVDIRVLPEALLHGLELLHAVDTLRVRLGEDKTRERFAELHTARPVRHTAETWAVPVDLARLGVERAASPRALLRLTLRLRLFAGRVKGRLWVVVY